MQLWLTLVNITGGERKIQLLVGFLLLCFDGEPNGDMGLGIE